MKNKHVTPDQTSVNSDYVQGRYGVVTSYNSVSHTVTVIISGPSSETADEILTNVPCPVILGIQSVAPEPGRPCWVMFKDGKIGSPLITHFYNHQYVTYDYPKQSKAPIGIPNYFLEL
jgi:hypothetical protein